MRGQKLSTDKSRADRSVFVLYALPDEQRIVELDFEPGLTAQMAVEHSGLFSSTAAFSGQDLVLGVWGVEVDAAYMLKPGDRVEISRPLQADPREMRREFLTDGRVMGGAAARRGVVKKKGRE